MLSPLVRPVRPYPAVPPVHPVRSACPARSARPSCGTVHRGRRERGAGGDVGWDTCTFQQLIRLAEICI